MKKILVTGADGFIGSHLVEKLIDKGFRVKAFTFYNSFNSWGWIDYFERAKLKELEIITGDIRDYDSIKRATKNCDLIFHLAALVGIPYSYYAPETYIDTNIKGTLNVLRAVKESKKNLRMIHTSTSEVYGTPKYLPITENHQFRHNLHMRLQKLVLTTWPWPFKNLLICLYPLLDPSIHLVLGNL